MKKTIISVLALVMTAGMSASATADSLENLERERALTVATMLDSTMDVEARWNKLNPIQGTISRFGSYGN